ncbi:MAG: transglutaminase domain-containing protein, partial [Anaerolineales bacterium]
AIETYLRAFPYTLDLPAPPADRDIVDYFLFDLQKGYCDYYASSMVVLARAAGIPARLIVGYITGTPQRTEGTIRYVVTEAEAHSWVEVYFPEIGWVEFDPTGGRPAIERAEAAPALSSLVTPSLELARPLGFAARLDVPVLAGSALLGVVVAWFIWVMILDPLRLQRRAPEEILLSLYERLRRLTSHLGIESSPGDTPYEFQAALFDSLDDGSSHIREPARELIGAHVQAAYAKVSVDRTLSARHIRAWRGLSFKLWLERVKRILPLAGSQLKSKVRNRSTTGYD